MKKIKKIIKKIIIKLFFNNKNLYYEDFFGSFNLFKQIIYIFFFPGRIINRIRFGQFRFGLYNKRLFNNQSIVVNERMNKESTQFLTNEEKIIIAEKELNKYGGTVIDGFFSESQIDLLKNKYQDIINNLKNLKSDDYSQARYTSTKLLPITDDLINVWLNNLLCKIISGYFGCKLIARNYPFMLYTHVNKVFDYHKEGNEKNADIWHVDHSTLLNLHIILEDLKNDDTIMQFLPGTNKLLNYASGYSNEYIETLGLVPTNCFGKRGTVYIHCGNAVHKLRPVSNKNRLVLHMEFTAGSNILLDCNNIAEALSYGFDINSISENQRHVLRGIFPKSHISSPNTHFKGYDLTNEKFRPTIHKGT